MFAIVQYRKTLEIVPENWIIVRGGREIVMWPTKNLSQLQKASTSKPVFQGEDKWIVGAEMVKRRGLTSYEMAEEMCQSMSKEPDTDSDHDFTCRTRQSANKPSIFNKHATIPSINLPEKIFDSPRTIRSKGATKFIGANNVPLSGNDDSTIINAPIAQVRRPSVTSTVYDGSGGSPMDDDIGNIDNDELFTENYTLEDDSTAPASVDNIVLDPARQKDVVVSIITNNFQHVVVVDAISYTFYYYYHSASSTNLLE